MMQTRTVQAICASVQLVIQIRNISKTLSVKKQTGKRINNCQKIAHVQCIIALMIIYTHYSQMLLSVHNK